MSDRYAAAKRLRRHHGSKALWWAEEYATANRGTKYGRHWAAVHDILKKAKNPPKLDKVVVRYANRVYDDLVKAINSGKLEAKIIYKSPPGVIATKSEVQYALKLGKRPIDLIVDSKSQGGEYFVPDDKKKPVRMTVYGWEIPSKSMFIHEFSHYLQWKHGVVDSDNRHPWAMTVADYLDKSSERDAYFIQFLSESVIPRLRLIERATDAEQRFAKTFGTKKAVAAFVSTYFKKSGLWKNMKPQTRKHHIDRLTEYIEHIRGS
jgi:hypothetical protein